MQKNPDQQCMYVFVYELLSVCNGLGNHDLAP